MTERLEERRAAHVAAPRRVEVTPLDPVRTACDAHAFGGRYVRALEEGGRRDELEHARCGRASRRGFGAAGAVLLSLRPGEQAAVSEVDEQHRPGARPRRFEQPFRIALGVRLEGELGPPTGAKRREDRLRSDPQPAQVHVGYPWPLGERGTGSDRGAAGQEAGNDEKDAAHGSSKGSRCSLPKTSGPKL